MHSVCVAVVNATAVGLAAYLLVCGQEVGMDQVPLRDGELRRHVAPHPLGLAVVDAVTLTSFFKIWQGFARFNKFLQHLANFFKFNKFLQD
jgi:hypothetical protein